MKSIFLLACALALASSTYVKPYHGPLHYTVIGKNGVPVDTAEVQHARAAHLLHKIEAEARNNHYAYAHHEAPLTYSVYELPMISHKGVPLDTKEVAAAKAIHFAAHAKALAGLQHHYRKRRGTHEVTKVYSGPQHFPIIGEKGVPIDTVEVQHARNAHLAHVAAAKSNYGYSNHAVVTPVISHEGSDYVQAYHGPQHLAVIGKNGVPIDTAEVQHARAAHLLHTAEVKARNSDNHNYSPISETYGYSNQNVHVPVVKYVAPYSGKLHFPVIVKGVPVDTVEVQHAKAAHLAAHAAASHGYHY